MKSATYHPRRAAAVAVLLVFAFAGWLVHHVARVYDLANGHGYWLETVYATAFLIMFIQVALAIGERPYVVTPRQQAQLDGLTVLVSVPVYNEDETVLRLTLQSLFAQTRLPNIIYVRDDGSTVDYAEMRLWAEAEAIYAGIELMWETDENRGKRATHARACEIYRGRADIHHTIDSDSCLDPQCIAEGIKPFSDPQVMSVASVVHNYNHDTTVLARATNLVYVTSYLMDRSAQSTMNSVLVNSGCSAFYRFDVVDDCLDGYLTETFAGKPVSFSDDSYLTLEARKRGKTVQQPTSISFNAMPEKLSHHGRQFARWMRGSFIRTVRRFQQLPVRSWIYWWHAAKFVSAIASTATTVYVFAVRPATHGIAHAWTIPVYLLVPVTFGYLQQCRIFCYTRDDEGTAAKVGWYLLISPLATLWSFSFMRACRWYGAATCSVRSWGTRSFVEVSVGGSSETPALVPAARRAADDWMHADTRPLPLHSGGDTAVIAAVN